MPRRRPQIFALIYWVTVAGLFSFAAWKRFSLPLDPVADLDTWGYLAPALRKLTGSSFILQGRNFVYPGFLLALLRFFGDFRAITIAQHLLGLAAGGWLLASWRQARAFVAVPRLPAWIHNALGLSALAIFLTAGDQMRAEMGIRPEGVCAFVLSLNLWFAVAFVSGAFVARKPPSAPLGIGLVLSAVLLASLKPSFILLAALAILPIAIAFLRPGFFPQKIQLAIGAAAGALLLVVPEYFLSRNDYIARMFLPTTLFVVHADMIRDQIADDLEHEQALLYPREWLSRVHADLTEQINKSAAAGAQGFSSLGFSPDQLMYPETSIAVRLAFEFEENPEALVAFCRSYYWRIWRHQPGAMLRKISRQMALFYRPICPVYDRSKFTSLQEAYRVGVSSLDRGTYPELWKRFPAAVQFMSRVQSLAAQAPPIEQRRALRRCLTVLARTYLPLLAIAVVVPLVLVFRRDYRRRLVGLAGLTLFVFSYNAAACLEVAVLHSLDVPRYSTVQFAFTLFAECLAFWLLLESVLPPMRWGRPIQTSAPGE